mmetsp:Transcript_18142/g.42901  ORF Transcript_18142/g.42901 Transcript_18142/m.42901 type:complete len:525 (+) Transcript_18142:347-1921(+)
MLQAVRLIVIVEAVCDVQGKGIVAGGAELGVIVRVVAAARTSVAAHHGGGGIIGKIRAGRDRAVVNRLLGGGGGVVGGGVGVGHAGRLLLGGGGDSRSIVRVFRTGRGRTSEGRGGGSPVHIGSRSRCSSGLISSSLDIIVHVDEAAVAVIVFSFSFTPVSTLGQTHAVEGQRRPDVGQGQGSAIENDGLGGTPRGGSDGSRHHLDLAGRLRGGGGGGGGGSSIVRVVARLLGCGGADGVGTGATTTLVGGSCDSGLGDVAGRLFVADMGDSEDLDIVAAALSHRFVEGGRSNRRHAEVQRGPPEGVVYMRWRAVLIVLFLDRVDVGIVVLGPAGRVGSMDDVIANGDEFVRCLVHGPMSYRLGPHDVALSLRVGHVETPLRLRADLGDTTKFAVVGIFCQSVLSPRPWRKALRGHSIGAGTGNQCCQLASWRTTVTTESRPVGRQITATETTDGRSSGTGDADEGKGAPFSGRVLLEQSREADSGNVVDVRLDPRAHGLESRNQHHDGRDLLQVLEEFGSGAG